MDGLTDEIESILYIAREVMGESLPMTIMTLPRLKGSVPDPLADIHDGPQSSRVERRELHLERSAATRGDRRAM